MKTWSNYIMNIKLGDEYERIIKNNVDSGLYGSSSDVIRDAFTQEDRLPSRRIEREKPRDVLVVDPLICVPDRQKLADKLRWEEFPTVRLEEFAKRLCVEKVIGYVKAGVLESD